MNILHFSTYDIGGAGSAAYRLHKALIQAGESSQLIVRTSLSGNEGITPYIKYDLKFRLIDRARRDWVRLIKGETNPDYCFLDREITYLSRRKLASIISLKPDVIVAHSISGFVSLRELYLLQQYWDVPVVWHLMDMGPMTGGCHFAWDCQGYRNQCGNCPALKSRHPHDQSFTTLGRKKHFVSNMRLTVVAPSHELKVQAEAASLFQGKDIHKILLSVDPHLFRQGDKLVAKQQLGLPPHRYNIFFGAHAITDRRKGLQELLAALDALENNCPVRPDEVLLTTAGNLHGLKFSGFFAHRHLGYLSTEQLSIAYQAADIFLCPSIEDSGPMMINEAIMCGTPVISFDIGVAPDLVITDKTGYRAMRKDGECLADGLRCLLHQGDEKLLEMSRACGKIGRELFSPESQARQFVSLFNSIV